MENRRRRLLLASGALLVAPRVRAQAGQTHWVAFLTGGRPSDVDAFFKVFLEGMRELGYRAGGNLAIDAQYAEYSAERAGKPAAEIAARKPAVIVAQGGGIGPACRLSPPLPVVFLHSGDPVAAGYVDSLARPGRNATGISLLALDLILKRMELLKQMKPGLRRIAFLASPEHAGHKRELAASRAAAAQVGVEVSYQEVTTPADLAAVLPKVAAEKPDAALLFSDALMVGQRQMLAEFFLRQRIPSATGWSAFVDGGHLLSYGADRNAVWWSTTRPPRRWASRCLRPSWRARTAWSTDSAQSAKSDASPPMRLFSPSCAPPAPHARQGSRARRG